MINSNRGFQIFSRTIVTTVLAGLFWLFSLPAFSAWAMPNLNFDSNIYYADGAHTALQPKEDLTQGDSAVSQARGQRIDAVEECKQSLNKSNKNTVAKPDKPLDKMGNDRLAGALKGNSDQTTVAEVEFKRCLEEKGVAPQP
ncbi:hypothetical protein [Microcoleus sp. FACHB-672]|uniref:hypothetical protein n=1 Tax=Microcoleus sp. FACHB-672 TaxID=2692825 RepID=UPI001681CBB3|nr:hypothetical protein [Microcoleus sp. FACHB-672]MBD2039396.1 hypothetical protein [Microcoleus sp. FACHB-672]